MWYDSLVEKNKVPDFLIRIGIRKLLKERLFQEKKETVELMKSTSKAEMFGKGLMTIPFRKHVFYGHAGDTYGTHSIVSYNEKDSLTVSFSLNGERFHRNDFAIYDRNACHPHSEPFDSVDDRWALVRPGFEQPLFGGNAISIWTSPLIPLSGCILSKQAIDS